MFSLLPPKGHAEARSHGGGEIVDDAVEAFLELAAPKLMSKPTGRFIRNLSRSIRLNNLSPLRRYPIEVKSIRGEGVDWD